MDTAPNTTPSRAAAPKVGARLTAMNTGAMQNGPRIGLPVRKISFGSASGSSTPDSRARPNSTRRDTVISTGSRLFIAPRR